VNVEKVEIVVTPTPGTDEKRIAELVAEKFSEKMNEIYTNTYAPPLILPIG
jgi:hypothetical protein